VTRGRRVLLSFLVLAAAGIGCSPRDHDNPLDPENPGTSGSPRWLTARAGDRAVDVSWAIPEFDDVASIRILRDDTGTVLWEGTVLRSTVTDAPVPNEVDLLYRIDLVLESGRVTRLPREIATPGRAIAWVYDGGSASVTRMTPDGREIRFRDFDLDASSLAVDPATGDVLVLDFFSGRVRLLDPEGTEVWVLGNLERPNTGLRGPDGWWVTDPGLGKVFLIDDTGTIAYTDSSGTFPIDLAPASGAAVWVADQSGPVYRLDPVSGRTGTITLTRPFVIAAAADGGAWVADRGNGNLVRLDAAADETGRVADLPGIEAMVPDPLTDGVWLADRNRRRVARVDGTGTVVAAFGGFPAPSDLAISPDGQQIWIADPALGALIRIARDGVELTRSTGISSALSVEVAFQPLGSGAAPTP
jgi:streptogramin lyase